MNGRYRFFAERVNFGRIISLHMVGENLSSGKRIIVQPVVMQEVKDDEMTSPMLQLDQEGAQSLMDELWHVGLRPTQGKQSEGQMDATSKHLNDMRSLVSALAKVELPKP